jgi:hypothetical protein
MVRVPVLSLAMHVVLPSVSIVSRFLTRTLMSFILTAVRVRATVSCGAVSHAQNESERD